MNIQFDLRTKLLVIAFTMSLVAMLTSSILIYTLMLLLSLYLILQGFVRQTLKYALIYCVFLTLQLLSGGR